jgi:hypothetical protein
LIGIRGAKREREGQRNVSEIVAVPIGWEKTVPLDTHRKSEKDTYSIP